MQWILQHQFLFFLALWLVNGAILLIALIRIRRRFRRLFGGKEAPDGNFESNLVRRVIETELQLEEIAPRLRRVESVAEKSIHKVGFMRFNPFSNTGGDNSFVCTLLDAGDNGVLISSLYTREGVRLYGKPVEQGVSRYPLSEEEKKVLEETLRK